jgi:pimeloyl-ACP methyl ester carboxylesterase
MLRIAALIALSLAVGCATLSGDDETPVLTITETSESNFDPVAFDRTDGLADYTYKSRSFKAQWVTCKPKGKAKAAVLAMHADRAGFDAARFCNGWIAQTFLAANVAVVTVNRPGYGASTGTPDFSGPQSQAAVAAAVKATNVTPAISGAWGYDTGATAAALLSRGLGGLQFLILGGGVYDMEETLTTTQDGYLRKDIERIKATGGNKAIEERSIAYDVSGLPKRIIVYHGKNDTAVPSSQAKAFADALESGEYKVTFQEIEGMGHDVAWKDHRKVLQVLVHAAVGS